MNTTRGHRNGGSSFLLVIMLVAAAADIAAAQQTGQGPSYFNPQNFNPSMAVIIVVLVTAFFFLGFFSIYIRRCAGGLPAPLDRLRKRWRRGTRQRCRQVRERRWRRRGVENLACYCRTRELTRMGCGELSGRAGVHKLVGWAFWAASCAFGICLKRATPSWTEHF